MDDETIARGEVVSVLGELSVEIVRIYRIGILVTKEVLV